MKSRHRESRLIIFLTAFILLTLTIPTMAAVKATFLYSLSDFTGMIPYNWARVSVDQERSEVYVLYQNTLRIFNENGMEIHRFGDDLDLGYIIDIAVEPNGDILLLAYKKSEGEIIHCNYRGAPKSTLNLKNLPDEFSKFSPNRMVYKDGNLYFASLNEMKIVIVDNQCNFIKGYDLIPFLELEEKDREHGGSRVQCG